MGTREVTYNGYKYTIDTETGTTTAIGRVTDEKAERNAYLQRTAGHDDREEKDDGGHLIAAGENGPPVGDNIHAQARDLNRGNYRDVERNEIEKVRQGYDVETKKTAFMSSDSERPSAYMISDTMTDKDGNKQEIHFSFTNMNNDEISEMEKDVLKYDEENDKMEYTELHGLSKEEYEEACKEADKYSSINEQFSDGWTHSSPDNEKTENYDGENIQDEPMDEPDSYDDYEIGDESGDDGEGDTW